MNIRLVVTAPVEGEESRDYDYVFQQDEIMVGRDQRLDVCIPAPEVSPEHARIHVEGDAWFVEDVASDTGTTVDGERLPPGRRHPVGPDSVIGVGPYTLRISRHLEEITNQTQEQTQQVAMQMVREVLGAIGGGPAKARPAAWLEVENDDEKGARAELAKAGDQVVVGREKDCGLRLSHWSVSRYHARFRRTDDGVTVEDLESKNKVMVNDTVIETPNQPRPVRHDDRVHVGHTRIRVHDPVEEESSGGPGPIEIGTSIIDLSERGGSSSRPPDAPPPVSPRPDAPVASRPEPPAAPAQAPGEAPSSFAPPPPPPPPPPEKTRLWLVLGIVLALALGGLAVAFGLRLI